MGFARGRIRRLGLTAMAAAIAIGVLALIVARVASTRRGDALAGRTMRPLPRHPGTASQVALLRAQRCWKQQVMAIKADLEARAEAEPNAPPGAQDEWRSALMARDEQGHLRQAGVAVGLAFAEARSPVEQYDALLWLGVIECDRGRHREELQAVRRLAALHPYDRSALGALRRAARHNGMLKLASEAEAKYQELAEPSLAGVP